MDPREQWSNEAASFTPWLAGEANLAALGDELGLELELEGTEVPVGPYSADLLARDTGTGRYVVIENQLEKTNHDHLGKVLTYGAVLDATTVVWIAREFTDEHRKALDWLNDHTDESLEFYAVEIELWRIGDSDLAPRLNVVSRPAQIVKSGKAMPTGELNEVRQLQLEFWTQVRDSLRAAKVAPSLRTPRPRNSYDVAIGRSHLHLHLAASTRDNRLAVSLYIHKEAADQALELLRDERDAIHEEIGHELVWNPYPDKRDKIIVLERSGDLRQRANWPEYADWLTKTTIAFRNAFQQRIKDLDLSPAPANGG
jgi:hypothetical protein